MIVVLRFAVAGVAAASFSALETVPDYPTTESIFGSYVPSGGMTPLMESDEAPDLVSSAVESGDSTSPGSIFDEWFSARIMTEKMILPPFQLYRKEWIRFGNETVAITPSDVITNRLESVLMHLEINPFNATVPTIIKYQIDCRERYASEWSSHQLVREFFYLTYINEREEEESRSVPRAYLLSSPVLLDFTKTFKTDFVMPESSRHKCVDIRSHLRYMIVEKTGLSLEDFISFCPEHKLPFRDGLNILRQLFVALKKIHSMGIIHGDIHRGNIVRSLRDKTKIFLIDFGQSFMHSSPLKEFPDAGKRVVRADASPWQFQGFKYSFRDDVMKAVLTVAALVGGITHIDSLEVLEEAKDFVKLLHYTGRSDVFRHPATRTHPATSLASVPDGKIILAIDRLLTLQHRIRSMKNVNDFPNHDELISIVDEVLEIVRID